MVHKLKVLGLALVAALAVSAASAASAAAEAFYFFPEEEATLNGVQHSPKDVFTTEAGSVACDKATYTGSVNEAEVTEVEVTPTYSECTVMGFPGTEFNMNGCKYRFTAGTMEGEKPEGTVDIVCPAGKEMAVVVKVLGVTKCTIHVPSQNGLGSVTYTNVTGSAHEVTVDVNVQEAISYTQTAGTGLGACASGSASNGSFAGAGLVVGKNAGEALVGVAVMAAKPLFVLNPVKLDFKKGGANSKQQVTIENVSKEKPKLDFIITDALLNPKSKYSPEGKCYTEVLDVTGAKSKCLEEVKCIQAGTTGRLYVGATESYSFITAKLENC